MLEFASFERETCEEFCPLQFPRIQGSGKPETPNLHFLIIFRVFQGSLLGSPLGWPAKGSKCLVLKEGTVKNFGPGNLPESR